MKKTQITDIFRLVTHNKGFFATMAVVIAFGTAAFAGINFATVSLFDSCEKYFDEYELYDLELASVYGFDEQTLQEVQETEGVDKIGTQYDTHALIQVDQDSYVAEFYTRPGDLNKERLTEGRLPEAADECVVEKAFVDRFGYKIGDKVSLKESSDMLTNSEYTIVGVAELVTVFVIGDYYNRGSSSIGDGQVTTKILLDESGFSSDAIKQICYVTMTDRSGRDSGEYSKRASELSAKLLPIVEAGDWRLYNKTTGDIDSQIDDALSLYESGTAELEQATSLLSYYESQLSQGKLDYASGMAQYEESASALAAARAELDYEQSLLDAARAQLDSAKAQLDSAKAQLDSAKAQLDATEAGLSLLATARDQAYAYMQQCEEGTEEYEYAKFVYEQASSAYDSSYAEYQSSLAEYEAGKAEYEASYTEYAAKEEQYSASAQEMSAAWSQYYSSANTLAAYKAQLDAAASEISASESSLNSQRSSISQGESELYDMNAAIIQAQQERAGLPWSKSFVADLYSNPSYYSYTTMRKGTTAVIAALCTLLMAIAILICYTTISRMVADDHRVIGTQKALGVRTREIFAKYLAYVVAGTLLGVVLGVLISYFFFEDFVIYSSYNDIFIMHDFTPIIIWPQVFLVAFIALAVMVLSAFLACRSLVKREAVSLLNDSIRDSKTVGGFGANSSLSLDLRIILRSLRSNPQVLATTLVSVAGCTILLISVLTVRSSFAGIAERQYNDIQCYAGVLTVETSASEEDRNALVSELNSSKGVSTLPMTERYVSYSYQDSIRYASLAALNEGTDPSGFLTIRDAETLEPLDVPDDGVLICLKIAETLGYGVGDDFALSDEYGTKYETTVKGIIDWNVGFEIVCSKSYYDQLTGTSDEVNQYYVSGSDEEVEAAIARAKESPAYFNYAPARYEEAQLQSSVESVNAIVALILAMSVLLSLFVLFNMAQMNIKKKSRDIVVMKVLGVPLKRIKSYIYREAMLMSICGLVIGVIVGAPLGSFLSYAVELDNLIGIRGMSLSACIIGAAVNFLIFTVINALSLRGVGKVKMTGSAREA